MDKTPFNTTVSPLSKEKEKLIAQTQQLAYQITHHALEMTMLSKGSHIGSILSVADIVAVLYGAILKVDPKNPVWPLRDRFILSKGHAGAAVYAALAERGFFPIDELKTHYQNGSRLSGHVSHKGVPGIEFSTGSLGHGLPVAMGMAMAAKKNEEKHFVHVVCGDGECNEGAMWEAALIANHFQLDNLICTIDYNKMQSLDFSDATISLSPLKEKWVAFGWQVIEVDGHDHNALYEAYEKAKMGNTKNKPTAVIAHTIKGKGISFMENNILWHYRSPQGDEYAAALEELEAHKP